MRKVDLRMNEMKKYEVIKDVVYGKKSKARAEIELSLTRRQIDRLILKYKDLGKIGFMHGNRNRIPVNALTKDFKDECIVFSRKAGDSLVSGLFGKDR